ncbi:hypothetical protein ACTHPH_09050 [Paenibacillus pasadenensis]|uniref:Uncharacterized protein n=1 Tax=Paenibacillus pasadenensis TaxID=217090 RepID=A0A2N5N865_9BACL|nr:MULTISPECIES: hypothetical protein [Paenibacillus]PLT46541.1 hypothetical protein B8V81_4972 [Paenibacillus pasadenensis]QGG56944.1 hypothetical protein GE073_16030 [Paenibacillus sp. B01]
MPNPIQLLINFLLDHIFFVFIIAGAIWSVLGKLFKSASQQQPGRPASRPPGRMPDFGGGGLDPRPQRPVPAPPSRSEREPAPRRAETVRPPAVRQDQAGPMGRTAEHGRSPFEAEPEGTSGGEGRSLEWREEPARSPFRPPERRMAMERPAGEDPGEFWEKSASDAIAESLPSHPAAVGSKLPRAGSVSGDDLRQAVLWAEILGPPRSRGGGRR